MSDYPVGTVVWAVDPTKAHDNRPVIILSHESRPFGSVECTVMGLDTGTNDYDHYAPELTDDHLSGISFSNRTVLMPWALYTIPPGTLLTEKAHGELTETGERRVKKSLLMLFEV